MAKKKEWVVDCRMTGYVSVFVEAATEEEAIAQAEAMEIEDSEITGWEVSQVLGARLNV